MAFKHTEETKRKLSEDRKGENNPFYGKKHTEETKTKLAKVLREHRRDGVLSLSPLSISLPAQERLAYLAGLIDGEGSIRIRKKQYPFVAIYNTHQGLMDWLAQTIGGRVGVDKRGREPQYYWTIGAARDVYCLVKAIYPYLIIKKQDADIVINFLEEKYGQENFD